MATISDGTRSIIDRYIAELEKNDIPIQEAVLFGSHSKGQADQWSDIDIALVSDVFEGTRIQDRKKIRHITLSISSELSPMPFRPRDFSPENPFVREILKNGIRIV